jgi:hypothetical protein
MTYSCPFCGALPFGAHHVQTYGGYTFGCILEGLAGYLSMELDTEEVPDWPFTLFPQGWGRR